MTAFKEQICGVDEHGFGTEEVATHVSVVISMCGGQEREKKKWVHKGGREGNAIARLLEYSTYNSDNDLRLATGSTLEHSS